VIVLSGEHIVLQGGLLDTLSIEIHVTNMIFEKKSIIFSILALIIGISSIIPAGYFLLTTAKAETPDEPWFCVHVPYAYLVAKNGTFDDYEYPDYVYTNETDVESVGHLVLLNFTLATSIKNVEADARIEYFLIELRSENGVIMNDFAFVGTNSDSSFGFGDFHFSRDGWFDTSNMSGGGLLKYNWTDGDSILWPSSGGSTGTIMEDSAVSKIMQAEELFITVYRLGWVTFSANSTLVTLSHDEVVSQIQLQKYGEGWLFNDLIPDDELAKTDLWKPVDFEYVAS
jgi:hypothetical protein